LLECILVVCLGSVAGVENKKMGSIKIGGYPKRDLCSFR